VQVEKVTKHKSKNCYTHSSHWIYCKIQLSTVRNSHDVQLNAVHSSSLMMYLLFYFSKTEAEIITEKLLTSTSFAFSSVTKFSDVD